MWAGQRCVRSLLVEVIINTARPQTNLFTTHLKQFHWQRNKSLTKLIENFRSDNENNYDCEFSLLRVVHLLHKVTGHANSEQFCSHPITKSFTGNLVVALWVERWVKILLFSDKTFSGIPKKEKRKKKKQQRIAKKVYSVRPNIYLWSVLLMQKKLHSLA